eukprot:1153202-Rhodomonas_salina.1
MNSYFKRVAKRSGCTAALNRKISDSKAVLLHYLTRGPGGCRKGKRNFKLGLALLQESRVTFRTSLPRLGTNLQLEIRTVGSLEPRKPRFLSQWTGAGTSCGSKIGGTNHVYLQGTSNARGVS